MSTGAEAVDELCRLALAAQRLGCKVRLIEVHADLREVLVAAGMDGLLAESGQQASPEIDLPRRDLR